MNREEALDATVLDAEVFDRLVAALDRPVEPCAALREAASRPRRFVVLALVVLP